MAKKTTTRKKSPARRASSSRTAGSSDARGKHLVIVESPTKARTINKYLGAGYVVAASVGHVRDLPKRAPKGVKQPVPGVDLDGDFEPTYEILPDKKKTVADLKKMAREADDVWFATDLDREGEAIAWHLAQALGIELPDAKRVVFNAITQKEIQRAFEHPRPIDGPKVDAQQARRILDRIVGYQVSPLLWKKVAGGLSAGRVQSVAVRLVVQREREIEAFVPEESWKITGLFTPELDKSGKLSSAWRAFIAEGVEQATNTARNGRTIREQNRWLNEHGAIRSELVEYQGSKVNLPERQQALQVAQALGFSLLETIEREDPAGKGPARHLIAYQGEIAAQGPAYRIRSIETRRTTARASAPFITSTLQRAAAGRYGFALQRTMRIAQQLYEGIDLKGSRGQTGLITYMRTDSTHVSGEALGMARSYIEKQFGASYLPEKPNFFSTSNKSAQEAHEAIRPTDVTIEPSAIRDRLSEEQFKLYQLIWEQFVACQMTPAQWDATAVLIDAEGEGEKPLASFRATGRTLVFDGHYRVSGVPQGDDVNLPALEEKQPVAPIDLDPAQNFTQPPPRYNEASLQKKLEEEGIGRPSTYASIMQTIQDRKYVETLNPRDRRLRATDLGKVVTDMLIEAFPTILDVGYTREMEAHLDEIEDTHRDWRKMLHEFYEPFKSSLEHAMENVSHAKSVTEPAPYTCEKCGATTMYRFGKNGRFLSCSRYPDCDYAAPIDAEGKPMLPEITDVCCPEDGLPMIRRKGRFGPFLASQNYPEVKYILKLDPKKQTVVLPKTPPLTTDLACPKCEAPLYMRDSKRGFWLSCSKFPKCRGRMGWKDVDEKKQAALEAAWTTHVKDNPIPVIRNAQGEVIEDGYLPHVEEN